MGVPWWAWGTAILLGIAVFGRVPYNRYRDRLRREFIEYLAAQRPELSVISESRACIQFQSADGSDAGSLFLHRLYQAGARIRSDDPAAKRELFQLMVRALDEGLNSLNLDPERDRARLRPRIVSGPVLVALGQGSKTEIPCSPIGVEGLFAVVVLDNENSVSYVTASHLSDLKLDIDSALDHAKDNLAATFGADIVRQAVKSDNIVVVKSFDTYDASKLLLVPRYLESGESMAALIPDRDTLVLTRTPSDGDWSRLRELARNAAGDPLWAEPVLVTTEGLSPAPLPL